MSRKLRISVPVSPQMERDIRSLCAQNGRSAASNLADLVATGLQKNDLDMHFEDLKSAFEKSNTGAVNHTEIVIEVRKTLATILAELRQKPAATDTPARGEVVFLPEKAAALLFEEALFSAKLSAEILAGSMPGAPQKPAGHHIAAARQKAKTALSEIIKTCQEAV